MRNVTLVSLTLSLSQYVGFLTKTILSLCDHCVSMNGPLDTNVLTSEAHLSFVLTTALQTGFSLGSAVNARKYVVGDWRSTWSVLASNALTPTFLLGSISFFMSGTATSLSP